MASRTLALLGLLWLVLWVPRVTVRYAYHWDSSQFARGEDRFDIAHHQPQPPGYPLWVEAARLMRGPAGNPYTPQVVLALIFTLAGLVFFRLSTRDWTPALLLAFSPVVMLAAGVSLTYAVDLFASSLAAWLAWQWWQGDGRWAVAGCVAFAVTMGFRPSGVTFLLPLLAYALYRLWKQQPWRAAGAAAAGAATAALWYVPTALSCGGFAAYSALNRAQFLDTARRTSVLLGAPPIVHLKMIVEVMLYLAIGTIALAPLIAARAWRARGDVVAPRTPLFYSLWGAPCLFFLLALHCPASGYVVLLLPAIVMFVCERTDAARPRYALMGVALALTVAWFPFSMLLGTAPFTPVYLVLRSAPSLARTIEDSQRELGLRLDGLRSAQPPVVVCLLGRPEAPNLRTVTYDFPRIDWVGADDPRALRDAAALLCDGSGPTSEIIAAYPDAQRVSGNWLYSLWLTRKNESRR